VLQRHRKVLPARGLDVGLDAAEQIRQAKETAGDVVVRRVVEPDTVDLEDRDPIKADVADEVLRALVVEVEVLQPWELTAEGLRRVRAYGLVAVEVLVWEVRAAVIEHSIQDDVDAPLMAR